MTSEISNDDDPRPRRRRPMFPGPTYELRDRTGPENPLRGRRPLVVVDHLCLASDADRCGFNLWFDRLAIQLVRLSPWSELHVILSAEDDAFERQSSVFGKWGWATHQMPTGVVQTHERVPHWVDRDAYMLGETVALLEPLRHDTIVLGTALAPRILALAGAMQEAESEVAVVSLALPGSSADRLTRHETPLVTANITIGWDCLEPIGEGFGTRLLARE